MRLAQILTGMSALTTAPCFFIPAIDHGWHLLSGLPQQPLQFSFGAFSFSGWACVGAQGGLGLLLLAIGYYVLFPPEGRR
jgi:hypothetical protein